MSPRPWMALAAAASAATLWVAPSASAAPGDLDPTFGRGGVASLGPDSERARIALQPGGKIVVAGQQVGGNGSVTVFRLTSAGALDTSFGGGDGSASFFPGGGMSLGAVAVAPDGRIVVTGTADPQHDADAVVYGLTAEGAPDPTFGGGDGEVRFDFGPSQYSWAGALLVQPDGRIVVAGSADHDFGVARLTASGTLDSSFSGDGRLADDLGGDRANVYALALQGSRLVLGGSANLQPTDYSTMRFFALGLTESGARDPGFGSAGLVVPDLDVRSTALDMVVTPDGGVLLSGYENGAVLLKLDASGQADPGFGPGGLRRVDLRSGATVEVTADGRYAVAGERVTGQDRVYAVAKLTTAGQLDPGFGTGGIGSYPGNPNSIEDLLRQPDGKLLLGVSGVFGGTTVLRIEDAPPPVVTPPPPPDGEDPPPTGGGNGTPLPRLSVSGGRAFEGALVPFTLTLDRVSTVPVSVDFITGDGTAERLRDYRGGRGTVTIPAGQLSATLQFTSLLDRLFEPDEQFRVELSNPVNARLDRHIDSATIANTLRTGRCANDVLVPAGISTLSGTSAGDRIRGRAASESLFGLAGHDCISGGRGHDLISGGDGNDVIDGDTGNDRLSGGSGNDRIDGGRGINRYSGGSGADRIDARNGRSERVDCGAGRDRVRADRSDRLRRCETVTR